MTEKKFTVNSSASASNSGHGTTFYTRNGLGQLIEYRLLLIKNEYFNILFKHNCLL